MKGSLTYRQFGFPVTVHMRRLQQKPSFPTRGMVTSLGYGRLNVGLILDATAYTTSDKSEESLDWWAHCMIWSPVRFPSIQKVAGFWRMKLWVSYRVNANITRSYLLIQVLTTFTQKNLPRERLGDQIYTLCMMKSLSSLYEVAWRHSVTQYDEWKDGYLSNDNLQTSSQDLSIYSIWSAKKLRSQVPRTQVGLCGSRCENS